MIGAEVYVWELGEWIFSCTSLGTEFTFCSSYSDSSIETSPCSSIRSVVTVICMLATPTGEFSFERPSLNKPLEALWGCVEICSGSSDFDGGTMSWVVGVTSWWSEYLDVTQYITNAFTMTSVPQLPRQTQPSWRPCINVNIKMFTQDVVSARRADHRVRIARR